MRPIPYATHAFRVMLASFVMAFSAAAPAIAQKWPELSKLHYQYFDAIHAGDIGKARDLVQLGGIDPNNIGGQPLVATLFVSGGKLAPSMPLLSDEAFDYLFKELKQSFNTKIAPNYDRTVFSLMCLNITRAKNAFQGGTVEEAYNTLRRIQFALAQGGDPKPLPNVSQHMRDDQPLPACVTAYIQFRNNHQIRSILLSVLDDFIKYGADPDYEQPIALAAEHLDVDLFSMLASHGADIGRVFTTRNLPLSCQHDRGMNLNNKPSPFKDTILGRLPYPKDADTDRVNEFLVAFIDAGGDVKAKMHAPKHDPFRCDMQHKTLLEKAVNAGQVTYAKMVQEFEKLPQQEPARKAEASPSHQAADSHELQGSRVVTSSFNVRASPALDGALMSTLGPNIVFEIEESSPDGEWTLINAPTIVRGWSNTAVLRRSSIPNGTTTTASIQRPAETPPTDMAQQIMMLLTGLDRPPYKQTEEFHNAHHNHIKTVTTSYELTKESPCLVKLRVIPKVTNYTAVSDPYENNPYTQVFDFKKMTRIEAKYTEAPEEGIWYAFAGGPSNPRLRKPRKVNYLTYFGTDSACHEKQDGTLHLCNKNDSGGGQAALPNPAKRPEHFQAAFAQIKSVCR